MPDFCWADHLAWHQDCRWVGGDACRDLGRTLRILSVLSVFSVEMLPGGWEGRFGISTQGMCWFSDSCFGGWIIVTSICCTECSALALFFFFLTLPWALLIHLKAREPHIHQHSEKAVGVFVLSYFGHWAFQVKLLAACREVKAPPLAHHPPPFPSSMAHTIYITPVCIHQWGPEIIALC